MVRPVALSRRRVLLFDGADVRFYDFGAARTKTRLLLRRVLIARAGTYVHCRVILTGTTAPLGRGLLRRCVDLIVVVPGILLLVVDLFLAFL